MQFHASPLIIKEWRALKQKPKPVRPPPFPDNPAPRNDHRYIVHADVFQQHTSSKTSCLPTQSQAVRSFPICDRHPYTQLTSHSTTNGVSEELFVNE